MDPLPVHPHGVLARFSVRKTPNNSPKSIVQLVAEGRQTPSALERVKRRLSIVFQRCVLGWIHHSPGLKGPEIGSFQTRHGPGVLQLGLVLGIASWAAWLIISCHRVGHSRGHSSGRPEGWRFVSSTKLSIQDDSMAEPQRVFAPPNPFVSVMIRFQV